MQVTNLIADGVEETIQGLHIFPVGMKAVVNGNEYEVVDVELTYANRLATVMVYLSKSLRSIGYTLSHSGEWAEENNR